MSWNATTLVREHYATYVDARSGSRERHRLRIISQLIAALVIGMLVPNFTEGTISVAVTSLSILAGFSFSAMFPIASDIKSGLPDPEFSEDQDDLRRLSNLSSFFRTNVSYFIPLTLITMVLFSIQLIEIKIPDQIIKILQLNDPSNKNIYIIYQHIRLSLSTLLIMSSAFIYLEVIYTFYRMSLNVLYILRIKEEYRSAHQDSVPRPFSRNSN